MFDTLGFLRYTLLPITCHLLKLNGLMLSLVVPSDRCRRVRGMLDAATVAKAREICLRGVTSGEFEKTNKEEGTGRFTVGTNPGGDRYENVFLQSKFLERIPSSAKFMDYVCHCLNNQPRLSEQ